MTVIDTETIKEMIGQEVDVLNTIIGIHSGGINTTYYQKDNTNIETKIIAWKDYVKKGQKLILNKKELEY